MLAGSVRGSVSEGSVPSVFCRLVGGNNKGHCILGENRSCTVGLIYTERDASMALWVISRSLAARLNNV